MPSYIFNQFTAREREILEKVCEGCTNREIARVLKIAEPTVKATLQVVYSKTRVNDRKSLIMYLFTHDKRPPEIHGRVHH